MQSMISPTISGYFSLSVFTRETMRDVDFEMPVWPTTTPHVMGGSFFLSGTITVPPMVETNVSVGLAAPWTSSSVWWPMAAISSRLRLVWNSSLSAAIVAIVTAAEEPRPDATGIFDDTLMLMP